MPVVNEVGTSAYTATKHACVRKILEWHMAVVNHIYRKGKCSDYWYVDFTAGPGDYEGVATAPRVAARLASRFDVPINVVLCERDQDTFLELESNVQRSPRVHLVNQDFMQYMPAIGERHFRRNSHGLVYYDPTKYCEFSQHLDYIKSLFTKPAMGRVDLLMNINANAIKKMRGAGVSESLSHYLTGMPKEHGLIREPEGNWQFVLLFFSNWEGVKDWKRMKLHRLDSEEGRAALTKACLTKEEAKSLRIEPTPSTSRTRSTGKCERWLFNAAAEPASDAEDAA